MENQIEIWKDILDYEGFYQVSNLGRLKSFHYGKERIMVVKSVSNNYFRVCLHLHGRQKSESLHRLIAESFFGRSNLIVNHKDGNTFNNNIENLEFVTAKDNSIHGYKSKKTSSKHTGVCWHKRDEKWQSYIRLNGKRKNLGYFDNELEAYNAYLKALEDNEIKSKYA